MDASSAFNQLANMDATYLIILALLVVAGEAAADDTEELPLWIADHPGFQNPEEVDSIKRGNGSIEAKGKVSRGWLVFLNERAGHGIELEVKNVSLDPKTDDFLLVSTWPLEEFKQMKLLTGKFTKSRRKLRIPSAKMLLLLYSASRSARAEPHVTLDYRRYGTSLELSRLPTENPSKKKEIVHEVQLKGKAPGDYSVAEFLSRVKEGIREAARRYCAANNVTFDSEIPTEEMVRIHKVTPCPFEWPDRHACASLVHSVFVSGLRIPDEEIILDYQLTADHLKVMWTSDFPELRELGITVFQLPPTSSTVTYWILIVFLIVVSSVVLGVIFWKADAAEDNSSPERLTDFEKVKKVRKPKLELSRHQRVPSFIFSDSGGAAADAFKAVALGSAGRRDAGEDVFEPGPIKNYFGSILFSGNGAYEDDDKVAETPSESPLVQQTLPLSLRKYDATSADNK